MEPDTNLHSARRRTPMREGSKSSSPKIFDLDLR